MPQQTTVSLKRPLRLHRLSLDTQRNLLLPATVVGLLIFLSVIAQGVISGSDTESGKNFIVIGALGIVLILAVALGAGKLLNKFPGMGWVIASLSGLVVGLIALNEKSPMPLSLLPLTLIFTIILALLVGRRGTYLFVIIISGIVTYNLIVFPTANPYPAILRAILLPIMSIVATETLLRLQKPLLIEMKRLETLNRVARSLATSIETHQVMSLISNAIQNALDADTYYVGMLRGESLHMELFYDDGEFFSGMDIPLKDTLAGIVLNKGESLLISDLVSERKKRNLPFIIVGRPRISSSWMGTPLRTGGSVVGLVAVASYQKYVFDRGDLDLLENIAQQAQLALDNASRHAEVETRSQQDSLTNVLNHNAFLIRLERMVHETTEQKIPLSLIMLDVDEFKHYNDRYGHLTGDKVLTTLCQVIRRNINKGDLVGRWGGEEFVIALPNATAKQAFMVAERIKSLLAECEISDRENNSIPAPTICQGIAEYQIKLGDYINLVDTADQQLYIAKSRGHGEIEPALGYSSD